MSKTMKKVSALLLALLMILSFMPMTQESAYAAAKKPGKVKNLKVKVSGKKMTISWKKAKNAKKYSVSIKDNSTKLTATKSTKKTKLKITGQYSTSYKITVKAVNGKKKGKGVSKKAKIGADPNKVDKKDYDEAIRKAQLGEEGMIFLEKQVADLTKILDSYKAANKECQKALDEATKLVEAYEKLVEEDPYYDLGDDFNKQVDKLKDAIEKAEEADKEAHKEEDGVTELTNDTWNDEVKNAINSMIKANAGQKNKYVVFDFDNTCSIYDVEEQLAVYQLQTMSFAKTLTVNELKDILATGIAQDKDAFPDGLDTKIADSDVIPGEGRTASYNDFITDIATAYQKLLDKGYEPDPKGVEFNKYADDPDWKEFATKMRAMYDFVFNAESADVAYPWVLYWFTGMTHDEVYDLATRSHTYYKEQPTSWETWSTDLLGSKVGPISYTWSCGTQVSENINELMAALDNNGIDVWVCSASATDPIRAAIDVWGLHDHVTGLMAMTNKYDGVFDNEYDYENGCAWYAITDGWKEGDVPTKAQTQGVGKSIAIQNVVGPRYEGHGPIAGFMDSTGDFNFCTEFEDLQVVCCFNRASRKPKDGGGLVAEIAVYEADTLGYDYDKAMEAGDTLYVLQGRDETGLRTLCNIPDALEQNKGRATIRVTSGSEGDPAKMFANADNQTQLDYIIENKMTVKEAFDTFAIKRKKGTEGNPFNFDIGFLKTYSGYHSKRGVNNDDAKELTLDSWNPEVKDAINAMIKKNRKKDKYVVFDFDNTCSIYDVEEQLAIYQLQTMSFAKTLTVDELKDILATGIAQDKDAFPDGLDTKIADSDVIPGDGRTASYNDFITDIATAYQKLLDKGYEPDPKGVEFNKYAEDPDWKEFATKMRAMYDFVFNAESADVAYPWVLYWFTGMTHDEVYDLATRSHTYYKEQPTSWETWSTEFLGSKVGPISYTWSCGTQVSENINELMAALDNNGIDVWVCSASATDPIRAAIDVWGLHDHVTGLMAMTNKYDGVFDNEYDYEDGCAWYPVENGKWEEGDVPTEAQTQGVGKSIAIQNVVGPQYYGDGPIAGFMDSTGDFNFCTEFEDLQVVCCFNRASRKPKDGGGLVAEIAVYEADTLGYDYDKAMEAGDTLYVLQGRDETGLRTLCNIPDALEQNKGRATIRVTEGSEGQPAKMFANADNQTQLDYIIEHKMSVKEAFDTFAIKRKKGTEGNPFNFDIGFLKKYSGYHSKKGEITKLQHEDWNPEVKDALNAMMMAEQHNDQYVVFDFDNTCSIFDVEEQLALHQLRTMSFVIEPKDMAKVLATELDPQYFYERQGGEIIPGTGKPVKANADYCENKEARYDDWITDIVNAYTKLWDNYGPFTAEGVDEATQAALLEDDDWKEFATKIRTMYDLVYDTESAAVAYPWVLYWFTGMTEEQVYQLAYDSHTKYSQVETERVKFVTPESSKDNTKIGRIGSWDGETFSAGQKFFNGTQVSDNIRELMSAFKDNGIDVWVCSASATDPIRAAIDVWGLHDYVTGLMAMTNKLGQDGKYINEYDWEGGYGWLAKPNGEWEKDVVKQKTQTQGKGKVIAVQNVLYPKYDNHGPIAGFMDSTGDFNFCTEFKTLQVVTCFNRADRKETDGGGVIAELAVHQADDLGYDYATARAAGDTLYVLQGRDEMGLRKLQPTRKTKVFKQDGKEYVFGSEYGRGNNQAQLAKATDLNLDTETFINDFAIKTDADDPKYEFPFKYGFVYGEPGKGLGPKFVDPTYNPAPGLDFSGYHSQN